MANPQLPPPPLQLIRKAIPDHCFRKQQLFFLGSLLRSIAIMAVVLYAGTLIPLNWKFAPVWFAFWVVSGTVAFGLWILGHQCGHQTFSKSKVANHVLGYLLHTTLLVPYFSWRWSHHVHHSRNNHVQEGQTHVPVKFQDQRFEHNFYHTLYELFGKYYWYFQAWIVLGPGWLAYLIFGSSGGPSRGATSHFNVPNALFPKEKTLQVHFSTLGLVAMLLALYWVGQSTSQLLVWTIYIPTWAICHSWLGLVTLLHHTDKEVSWYDSGKWNWLRGALCSVDRNYPPLVDWLHHHIGTTHVLHHLFPEIPHYHAKEATAAIRKVLGRYYNSDERSIFKAFKESVGLLYVHQTQQGEWRF